MVLAGPLKTGGRRVISRGRQIGLRIQKAAGFAAFESSSRPSFGRRCPVWSSSVQPGWIGYRSMATTARAIVAHEPSTDPPGEPGANWKLDEITVPDHLHDGELLVEMVASGICHTDLLITSGPSVPGMGYPRVVGHEGSGIVKAVGPNVSKKVSVGDPVLLSFDNCGTCESCVSAHPAYCDTFIPLNIAGREGVFQTPDGEPVQGQCFGQSSFSSLSIVKEGSILPAKGLLKDENDIKLFAPLGCGIQTGAGAVLNVAKPSKDDRVMVLGLGGVGLSAVMGAAIAGCKQIVAVDRVASRIELAKSLGATHGLNTSGKEDYVEAFKEVTGGLGPSLVVDSTAFLPLLTAGYNSLAPRGTFVFIGASSKPEYTLPIDITTHMMGGRRLLGCCEGDSVPAEFIPTLIENYRKGLLPIDKLIKFYPAKDFQTAIHDMHTGETIKPVILW